MSKKVNHFEAKRIYLERLDTHLSVITSEAVPFAISALETRKGRSFWQSQAQWEEAYQGLTSLQMRLLMDAADRIVNEVRATRNGPATGLLERDPTRDPYALQLASLKDIADNTENGPESIATILADIRTAIQQLATAQQANNEELIRIGAIIAGAL